MTQVTNATSPSTNGGRMVSKFSRKKNSSIVKSPTLSRSPSVKNVTQLNIHLEGNKSLILYPGM